MGWLEGLSTSGYLDDAIVHLNHAIDSSNTDEYKVTISGYLFDSLNKLQTEWVLHSSGPAQGELRTFTNMFKTCLSRQDQLDLLRSRELADVVSFRPLIMSHRILRRLEYRPDIEIAPELAKEASVAHSKVVSAYNNFLLERDDDAMSQAIILAAELLYIVRSNIAHGEKTPYGPDHKKAERDEAVCHLIVPLQFLALSYLLDRPDHRLAIYGTLAPGRPNHRLIEDLHGSYEECWLHGGIEEHNDLSYFHWQPRGPKIKSLLFTSSGLQQRWRDLDRFEGNAYKRRVIPVERSSGLTTAYVYVAS